MLSSRPTARRALTGSLTTRVFTALDRSTLLALRNYSETSPSSSKTSKDEALNTTAKAPEEVKLKKKTQAELDHELQLKLQGLAGDGGDAGVEYEDGKPVSMKRSVRNNMFRYI